jgi:asparagine synthase (glutamine-hydrolysing)
MSGVVAMFNRDGAPIDRVLLDGMTAFLAFRGTDAQHVQALENVGFGHTLLETSDAPVGEEQPFTLDGRTWIVADARVDAREELVTALRAHGHEDLAASATDVELILRAYHAWGEDCVAHLLGDFMFAIWDPSRQHLFCARDHLGVKPFFYAQLGPAVVISNTLDCIRLHPAASRDLDDSTIADFLLFGVNQDSGTTAFRDIRRLPPAHTITWTTHVPRCRRYWTLPIEEPIHFKRAGDYSDRFRELLSAALRDRLRTRRVAVLMSGGVDSPTLAATALRLLREDASDFSDFSLRAITSVYDRLIPDSERYYAGLVAEHLHIPIRYDVRDDEISIAQWDQISVHTPEPVDNPPAFAASVKFFDAVVADARVFLYGEGPDDALRYEWRPYLWRLLAEKQTAQLMRAVSADLWMHRRIPFWSSIRRIAASRRADARWMEDFPGWLTPEFATRCQCRDRWETQRRSGSSHPTKPVAYGSFSDVRWQSLLEGCDLSGALSRADIRHPFLDLRVVQYMLALPAMPWCRNKAIIRRTMRTELPHQVLRRPKSSVEASPDFERVKASGLPRLVASRDLLKYVNPDKIPLAPRNALELRSTLRPLGLNYWLRDLGSH